MRPERLGIAFATPEYVTEKCFDGGLANYLHRLAKSLAGMGHDIHVLTLSEIDEAEFEHEGVTVHRITSSKWWPQLFRLPRYRLATTPLFLDFSIRVYRRLKWLNSQHPIHLVQFPNYSGCLLTEVQYGFENYAGKPYLLTPLDHLSKKLRGDLGLPKDCVIHSLRHKFLTRFGEAGAGAFNIEKVARVITV